MFYSEKALADQRTREGFREIHRFPLVVSFLAFRRAHLVFLVFVSPNLLPIFPSESRRSVYPSDTETSWRSETTREQGKWRDPDYSSQRSLSAAVSACPSFMSRAGPFSLSSRLFQDRMFPHSFISTRLVYSSANFAAQIRLVMRKEVSISSQVPRCWKSAKGHGVQQTFRPIWFLVLGNLAPGK